MPRCQYLQVPGNISAGATDDVYVKSTGTFYLKILEGIVSMAISYPCIKICSNIV